MTNKKIKNEIDIQTDYGSHICIIEPDINKSFIIKAKNLPGVITCGKNRTQAINMAKEAIELCIECLAKKNMVQERKIIYKSFEKALA